MRYKATIEYDGSGFFGWQRQPDRISVQERLELALLPLSKTLTTIHGAGRTDTGVHAIAQVAHFDLDRDIDPFVIQQCMNHYLADVPISVLLIEKVQDSFHARFSAKQREYVYKILNRRAKPSLLLNKAWWVQRPLDEAKMHSAALNLLGTHDFSAFRAQGCQAKSPIKTVIDSGVTRTGDIVEFYIKADAFLYHQVRNMIGSLYNVGSGKWTENEFIDVFNNRNRAVAGMTAPACGLYFKSVSY